MRKYRTGQDCQRHLVRLRLRMRGTSSQQRWRVPDVDEAIWRLFDSGDYDVLLDPQHVDRWGREVSRLNHEVTDALSVAERSRHREVIAIYVSLASRDWFWILPGAQLSAWFDTRRAVERQIGLQYDDTEPDHSIESFFGRSSGSMGGNLQLHWLQRQQLLLSLWGGGEQSPPDVWMALGTDGQLAPFDRAARTTRLTEDVEAPLARLARAYRELRCAVEYEVYQSRMHHGHMGLEPFPEP